MIKIPLVMKLKNFNNNEFNTSSVLYECMGNDKFENGGKSLEN